MSFLSYIIITYINNGGVKLANTTFDQVIERRGTNSTKWDATKKLFGSDDVLPMWVADMDFKAPEEVLAAIKERVEHGVFGYNISPPSTSEAIVNWVKKRHGWDIQSDWISYNPGVVTAMAMAIGAFTLPRDRIVILTPVYQPFFHLVERNDRELVTVENILVNEQYEMDFTKLEDVLSHEVKMLMLCNPHNPGGKVWKKEDLIRLGELCVKHDILILSDDIHSDMIVGEIPYTPISSLSEEIRERTITFIAPSKTFNLAGLQASAVIIPNKRLKLKFDHYQGSLGFYSLNTFGLVGMEAAYQYGEKWFDELLTYLKGNIQLLVNYIEANLPKIKVIKPEATYLVWLDCRGLGLSDEQIQKHLIEKGKIGLEPGKKYGPGGEGFVRINIGCSRTTLEEGLQRLKLAFEEI